MGNKEEEKRTKKENPQSDSPFSLKERIKLKNKKQKIIKRKND